MKKKSIFVGALLTVAALSLAGCQKKPADTSSTNTTPTEQPTKPTTPTIKPTTPTTKPTTPVVQTFKVVFYADGKEYKSVDVKEKEKVTKPTDPTKSGYSFIGWFSDEALTKAYDFNTAVTGELKLYAKFVEAEVQTAKFYIHKDGTTAEVEPVIVPLDQSSAEGAYGIPEVPATLEDDYRTFAGWYTDAEFTTAYDASYGISEDTHIYAKWNESIINANFRMLASDLGFTGKSDKDTKKQIFVVGAGTEIRKRAKNYTAPDGTVTSYTHSVKMNGTAAKFTVNIPAAGTLKLYVQNGSSTSASKLDVLKPDGTTDLIGYGSGEGTAAVNLLEYEVEAGTYVFTSNGGTLDIFDATFACPVTLSPIQDIEVTNEGLVDYIEGQKYVDAIEASIIYKNETSADIDRETMAGLTVDTSALDLTKPGKYNVTVKYEVTEMIFGEEKSNTYSKEVEVNVYQLEDIDLGFNATKEGKNSYNGIYINDTVQVVYVNGMKYDASALNVTAVTKDVTTNEIKTFLLDASDYVNDAETSFVAEGAKKTITLSYTTNDKTKTASYSVYLVAAAPSVVDGKVQVAVNQKYEGEVGAVVEGYNTFTSIQQALDFLTIYYNAEGDASIAGKNIELKLAAGYYNEKIEINLPNMTIVGAGKDTTMIEWDSLYGINDESGYLQVTDSTATVAVREEAVNCKITGVTISNWYNSTKNFQDAFGVGYGEHRALAIIIQADQFIMDDCALLGYQDTIELMTGRQLITNTLITGTTDFIFGTNNTTYFYGCEIRTIVTEKNSNGGYITAFKGANKGAADSVKYGAIFDNCDFTCEEGVQVAGDKYTEATVTVGEAVTADTYYVLSGENYVLTTDAQFVEGTKYYTKATVKGVTAIARPWGTYAAVAVINSELGGHISTEGWDGTKSQNLRYVSMSGNAPDGENTKFFEYNNTGAGAITEAVRGCQMLTAEEAAKYSDQKVIFAATNGNVSYSDSWAGSLAKDVSITVYNTDGTVNKTFENYAYNNTTLSKDEITALIDNLVVADGMIVTGLYTDVDCTKKFDGKITNINTALYVTVETASPTEALVGYDGSKYKEDGYAWTTSMASAGSQKISPTIGGNKDSLDAVSCAKLNKGDYILSPKFSDASEISLEMLSASTGTGNPINAVVYLLAADGTTVVKEVKWESVTTGKVTTKANITITSDVAFNYIKIAMDTPADKNFGILSLTGTITLFVDKTVISKDTTFSFNSGDSTATSDTYFVAKSTDNAQGATSTIGNLTIDASATGAKFSDNGGSWFQFNTGTKLIFKVKAGAKVQLVTYQNQDLFKLLLNDSELTKGEDGKYSITADGTVTIEATSNGYVGYLYITY